MDGSLFASGGQRWRFRFRLGLLLLDVTGTTWGHMGTIEVSSSVTRAFEWFIIAHDFTQFNNFRNP